MLRDNVSYIMTKAVVKTAKSSVIREAARLMHAKNVGSLVVSEGGAIDGIVTERDVLRFVNSGGDLDATPVAKLMTKVVVTIPPSTSIIEAADLLIRNRFRRLPVVDGGALVGIVTTIDLTYELISDEVSGMVSEYMTKGVHTISPAKPVTEAVKAMVEHNIGCIVVVDEEIRGIITERDIVALAANGGDPNKLLAADIMTPDVIHVAPATEVGHACKLLYNWGFTRLPVVDEEGKLVGIVSGRDLIKAIKPAIQKKG